MRYELLILMVYLPCRSDLDLGVFSHLGSNIFGVSFVLAVKFSFLGGSVFKIM